MCLFEGSLNSNTAASHRAFGARTTKANASVAVLHIESDETTSPKSKLSTPTRVAKIIVLLTKLNFKLSNTTICLAEGRWRIAN